MNCIMNQSDWLKDLQTDYEDMPKCEIYYVESLNIMSHINSDYNLFDYMYGTKRYIYLSELLEIHDSLEWKRLIDHVEQCDSITIAHDLIVKNNELIFAVNFYIRVFYCQLRKHCPCCYLYVPEDSFLDAEF